MDIKTKYDIGQKIYRIEYPEDVSTKVPCSFCNSTGKIVGMDETIACCPTCSGCGSKLKVKRGEPFVQELTIGQIEFKFTKPEKSRKFTRTEERLMCYETGIGSGVCYVVADKLFFSTKEEAEEALEVVLKK